MAECPHMSGDATCSICEQLQQLQREHEIALRRLQAIADERALQPALHALAAFREIKESRKANR